MTIADSPPMVQYIILGFLVTVVLTVIALVLTLYFGYRRRK